MTTQTDADTIADLLDDLDPDADTYTVTAYGLTHDGGGWSVNQPFTISTKQDRAQTAAALAERLAVFVTNYEPATAADVQEDPHSDGHSDQFELEANGTPFARVTVHRYAVQVGNIGETYEGTNQAEARETFEEYAEQSRDRYGRAAGEDVTLTEDGEPTEEHEGEPPAAKQVADSLTNGQRTQARDQMNRHGLTLADMVDHYEQTNTEPAAILDAIRPLFK